MFYDKRVYVCRKICQQKYLIPSFQVRRCHVRCPAMLRQEGLCRLGAKVSQIFCQYQTDSCSQKQKFSILLNNNNEDDNTNNNTNVQAILSREDLCRRQGNSYMPVKLAQTYQME